MSRRGFCAACGLICALSRSGNAWRHNRVRSGFGNPLHEVCPGSGKTPRDGMTSTAAEPRQPRRA